MMEALLGPRTVILSPRIGRARRRIPGHWQSERVPWVALGQVAATPLVALRQAATPPLVALRQVAATPLVGSERAHELRHLGVDVHHHRRGVGAELGELAAQSVVVILDRNTTTTLLPGQV